MPAPSPHAFHSSTRARIARIPDLVWGPLWEALLVLIAGATAVWSGHPWLFTSLGPTAYELAEKPDLKSARFYNVVVGHFVGIGCGFTAVALLGAWDAPSVNAHALLTPVRMWTATVAVFLTVLLNLLLKSGQPAALATTLLISLGAMQTADSALWLATGVLIVACVGEPLRRIRLDALIQAHKINDPRHPEKAEKEPPLAA